MHLSFYEAAAYANWAGGFLPTEFQWEQAALQAGLDAPAAGWQWTQSDYAAYPGYKPFKGALQEYNAKFMCSQKVLRGGSFATPEDHYRPTYRNFFYPQQNWHFSAMRMAYES
jgi:formylglycine-generating enzyme required for sulfatase activity